MKKIQLFGQNSFDKLMKAVWNEDVITEKKQNAERPSDCFDSEDVVFPQNNGWAAISNFCNGQLFTVEVAEWVFRSLKSNYHPKQLTITEL